MNIIIRYILPEHRDFDLVLWDGWRFWLANGWFIQFQAQVAEISSGRPYGLKYSLTLHDASGKRLLGYDNAHGLPASTTFDHRHRYKRTREVVPYAFIDSFQLITDFMEAVGAVCKREGIEFRFIAREECRDEN